MNSIRSLMSVILLSGVTSTQAALPPSVANLEDLNTMVQFISQHPIVAQSLKQIDLTSLTIFFDYDCEVYFERQKPSYFEENIPGPQPGIVFKSSTCAVVDERGE